MNSQFCTRCGARLAPKAHFCKSCGTAVSARIKQKSSRRRTKLRKQPPWLLLILIIGGALIILAVLLYQSVPPAVVDVPDEHDASGLPYPNISRISVTETKERIDNGTAIIVDVRGAQEYAEAHIPNALSIPLDELQLRYQELAPNTEIITYCT